MTTASFFSRQRRTIAICALSLLLHALAIGWAGSQLGGGVAAQEEQMEPQPIMAALIKPAAPAPPVPKPAPPERQPAPSKAVRAAPPPVVEAAEDTIATAPLPQPELAPDSVMLEDLALEEVAPNPADPPVAAPAEPAATPRYRVSLPPSTRLSFEVTRKDANGSNWSGSSEMDWQRGQGSYRLSMEAFVSMLVTRVNVGKVNSEGVLNEDGIAPRRVLEKRMGRAQTATHFDAEKGRITFSSSERSVALLPGAQDKASVQFQLAGIARADSAQLAAGVEIQVGSDRDAPPYRFVLAGEEEIDTPMGRLATWRLTRPPLPGAYNARLDIWLAPQHGWLPVKVRSLETSGAVTTQTIRKIVTNSGNEGSGNERSGNDSSGNQ